MRSLSRLFTGSHLPARAPLFALCFAAMLGCGEATISAPAGGDAGGDADGGPLVADAGSLVADGGSTVTDGGADPVPPPDAGEAPDAGQESADAGAVDAGSCPSTEANCGGGLDGDCDGEIDCADPDCSGRACDDGDRCTEGESCSAGGCRGGEQVFCTSAPGPCYEAIGSCASASGCAYPPKASGTACADDGSACTADACDGAGGCAHAPLAAGTLCRASQGGCDPAERCDGTAAPCPDDERLAAGSVCRSANGGCDKAETCDGTSPDCPSDLYDSACTCPENGPITGYAEHDGLRSITASKFVLRDTGTWTRHATSLDALGLPVVGLDVLDLNRTATKLAAQSYVGYSTGFSWASGDQEVAYWIPQGLAGGSAGSRKYVVVSWHYDEANNSTDTSSPVDGTDKGVRVSFVDVTDTNATIGYRNLLLVEPDEANGFKAVRIHAGGMAWYGNYLYVADTSRGLRVFDLTRILRVSTSADCSTRVGRYGSAYCGYGYLYVLPQIGGYYFPSGLSSSCKPLFSFISLDRSSSPPSILSGEYDNDTVNGIYSRILRWPLDSTTKRLATDARGAVDATGAWYAGSRNLQGAAASGGKFFLNATRYYGALLTSTPGSASRVYRADAGQWGWMPEGMYISTAGNLWVNTEGQTNHPRIVFAAKVADIP